MLFLFIYNMRSDFESSFGGYPIWANVVFGWIPAVALPFCMFIYGIAGGYPCCLGRQSRIGAGEGELGAPMLG